MTDEQNARDIAAIRDDMKSLVRQDVYNAEQKGVVARVVENEKDIVTLEGKFDKSEERRAADRRLILTSLVLPIIVAVVLLYVQSQIGAQ